MLEEELGATHKELMILKEQNNQKKTLTDGVLDVNHEQENTPSTNGKRSSDGSLSHEEDLAKVIELQEVIDKQAREQSQMKERLAALSSHVTELEEDLDTARKDLIKSEEVNTKLQRDVREVSERRNRGSVVESTGVCRFSGSVPFVPNSPSCSQLLDHCLSDRTGWHCDPGGCLPFLWSNLLSRGASGHRTGVRPPTRPPPCDCVTPALWVPCVCVAGRLRFFSACSDFLPMRS